MAYAEKRANGWRVKYKTGPGPKDWAAEPGFPTKTAALEWGRDREADVRAGRHVERARGDVTLGEFADRWLAALDVAPSSYNGYRKRLQSRIKPRFGSRTLKDLEGSALEIQGWAQQLRAEGLAESYVREILGVLRLVADAAIAERRITTNPVQLPSRRRGRYVREERPKRTIIHPEQALALAENHRIVWGLAGYVFVLTQAYTGMRAGELFGLRREFCYPNWPAADPDRVRREEAEARYGGLPCLRVQWQDEYEKPRDGGKAALELGVPKYASRRTLILPPFLAGLLKELLGSHDCEWVFPSLSGKSLATSDFSSYYWKPALGCEERKGRYARPAVPAIPGLESLEPHELRHSHKVWLDEDGHPRVAVEERMGHRVQGVEGVYSHTTVAMEERIAEALEERWQRSLFARARLAQGRLRAV